MTRFYEQLDIGIGMVDENGDLAPSGPRKRDDDGPNCGCFGDKPDPAKAIEWVRAADHNPGCFCGKCKLARPIIRKAVRTTECGCGWCPLCWARAEISEGRI